MAPDLWLAASPRSDARRSSPFPQTNVTWRFPSVSPKRFWLVKQSAPVPAPNGASLNVSFSGCAAKNRLWCPLAVADRAPPISVPITPTELPKAIHDEFGDG